MNITLNGLVYGTPKILFDHNPRRDHTNNI